jgi:hypothetical protein
MPTITNPNQYFDATLYTGSGSGTLAVTNAGQFQPDLVWLKERNNGSNWHSLFNSVVGRAGGLATNVTNTEFTSTAGNDLVSFNSNGFTVGPGNQWDLNNSTINYVGWNWKAGGTAVSNTAGSITSSVSVNTTAGFSITTFTCPASGNFTVGHGLGVTPAMFIVKDRQNTNGWPVWHQSLGTLTQNYMALNTTAAVVTGNSSIWANTAPTSSVVSFGSNICFNPSANAVMYAWAPVAGYSAFGSYTGNGSTDGPFVYLNFRPKFIMIKRTDVGGGDWVMHDTSRATYNLDDTILGADISTAEQVGNGYGIDELSNGFKLRNAGTGQNASGGTFIYAAFAEAPFKFGNAR